jgi:hypothetical protein
MSVALSWIRCWESPTLVLLVKQIEELLIVRVGLGALHGEKSGSGSLAIPSLVEVK